MEGKTRFTWTNAALRCPQGPTTPTNMAADALATCHSVCHASHAAASPACENGGGARVGGCLWGEGHVGATPLRPGPGATDDG